MAQAGEGVLDEPVARVAAASSLAVAICPGADGRAGSPPSGRRSGDRRSVCWTTGWEGLTPPVVVDYADDGISAPYATASRNGARPTYRR